MTEYDQMFETAIAEPATAEGLVLAGNLS